MWDSHATVGEPEPALDIDLFLGAAPPPITSYPPGLTAPFLGLGYARQCQWILGKNGLSHTMCGAETVRASWCQVHAKRVFASPRQAEAMVATMDKYAGITRRR